MIIFSDEHNSDSAKVFTSYRVRQKLNANDFKITALLPNYFDTSTSL